MFDTPEAASGDCALLCCVGDLGALGGFCGTKSRGTGSEGPEDAGEEVAGGHCVVCGAIDECRDQDWDQCEEEDVKGLYARHFVTFLRQWTEELFK